MSTTERRNFMAGTIGVAGSALLFPKVAAFGNEIFMSNEERFNQFVERQRPKVSNVVQQNVPYKYAQNDNYHLSGERHANGCLLYEIQEEYIQNKDWDAIEKEMLTRITNRLKKHHRWRKANKTDYFRGIDKLVCVKTKGVYKPAHPSYGPYMFSEWSYSYKRGYAQYMLRTKQWR